MRYDSFAAGLPLLFVLLQTPVAEKTPDRAPCRPCASDTHGTILSIRADLQEAFRLSTTTEDCSGDEHLEICRAIEGLLEQAFEGLEAVFAEAVSEGAIDCIGCDPGPYVRPLFGPFESVAELLQDRGYAELRGRYRRMQQELELWKGYRCCGEKAARAGSGRNREMEARAALTEKCGTNFEKNRQELRQVVRMPGDRDGCYQSRACRDATERDGQLIQAGFWTYDGEYWYVWGQRRTPRGEWVSCEK